MCQLIWHNKEAGDEHFPESAWQYFLYSDFCIYRAYTTAAKENVGCVENIIYNLTYSEVQVFEVSLMDTCLPIRNKYFPLWWYKRHDCWHLVFSLLILVILINHFSHTCSTKLYISDSFYTEQYVTNLIFNFLAATNDYFHHQLICLNYFYH